MPSFTESFGLVYAEAMSQGLPVIYSKGQGFDGQFAEGVVGYHVDAHDPEELCENIIKMTAEQSTFYYIVSWIMVICYILMMFTIIDVEKNGAVTHGFLLGCIIIYLVPRFSYQHDVVVENEGMKGRYDDKKSITKYS